MGFTIVFTHHAVERYVERHARDMPHHEARTLLEASINSAVKLKAKTFSGEEQWRIEELGIVLVTKRDYGEYVCVTILPNFEQSGMTEEELEHLEDLQRRYQAQEEALRKEATKVQEGVVEARPKASFPPGEKARQVTEGKSRIEDMNRQLEVLRLEQIIISSQAKTIRHTLTMAENERKMKLSLRASVKFLMDHAVHHPEAAAEVMAIIRVADPGFLTPEFYNLKKAP